MIALYWFALVVGVGMYLFSVFADAGGDADASADAHVEVGHDGHHGLEGFRILTMRNITYFLFAFGVTGVALTWLWGGRLGLLRALLAVTVGTLGAGVSALTFGWLRRSESGELPGDATWAGVAGEVTIPISSGSAGKILVRRGSREHELLARPFEDDARDPERWTSVMVVEVRHGVALVTPNEILPDDAPPGIPPAGATSET